MIELSESCNTNILKYLTQGIRHSTLNLALLKWRHAPLTCRFVIEHQTYKFSVFLEHQGFAMNSLVCEALNSIANDALMSLIHTFDTMVELLQTTPQINAQEKTPIPLYCGASICAFKPLVKVFKA